jgi:transposase-like protein
MKNAKMSGTRPKCPLCHVWTDVRKVEMTPGYNPDMEHYCCDYCKVGWYELPKSRNKKISGSNYEMARQAYDPEDRPKKLPSGRPENR